MQLDLEQIQKMIYVIRGQKVMLDSDLASLYGVETKYLNKQVKRNIERFPDDFLFQLTLEEHKSLRFHFGTSSSNYGGRRYQPYVFTELGVAMLSSILKSKTAVSVNISIMRTFVKLRSYYALDDKTNERIDGLNQNVTQVFKVVFERLDNLEEKLPSLPKDRRRIGIKNKG